MSKIVVQSKLKELTGMSFETNREFTYYIFQKV